MVDLISEREASRSLRNSAAGSRVTSSSPASIVQTTTTKVPTKTADGAGMGRKEKKKYIMLRESLPGGWKEVDENEDKDVGVERKEKEKEQGRAKPRAWRYSQVEFVDLSAE
jgi:hypothetical protein